MKALFLGDSPPKFEEIAEAEKVLSVLEGARRGPR